MVNKEDNTNTPDNIEMIESSLLSLIINSGDSELLFKAFEKVEPDDFNNQLHKKIYTFLINTVIKKGLKIDKALIASSIKQSAAVKQFEEIIAQSFCDSNFNHYLDEIKNHSRLRNFKSVIRNYNIKLQTDEKQLSESMNVIDLVSKLEDDLLKIATTNKFDTYSPKDLISPFLESIRLSKPQNCISTSFRHLDQILNGGLQTNYYIIAARPSVGKSQLAINTMVDAAKSGKACLFFSLEMDEISLLKRIISNYTEIPLNNLMTGALTDAQMLKLESAAEEISNLPIHIDASNVSTPTEIMAKAKRFKIKHPDLALIVVDYIQLLSGDDKDTRNNEVGQISRAMKNISRTLKIPVIAVSQLNRAVDLREDKRPILSDLRDSGNLEQDTDVIMFLYREDYYDKSLTNNDMEIIVAKHRNGPLGTITVNNVREIQKFYEY